MTENGSGEIILEGADEDYYSITDSAYTALNFIRLRARELCLWMKTPGLQPLLRDPSRDIMICMMPVNVRRDGASVGVGILLALMKLYMGCIIKPNTAMTGSVSLTGDVLGISGVVAKIRGALEYGAVRVMVPSDNAAEAKGSLKAKELEKVIFVSNVLEVFHHAIEGKIISDKGHGGWLVPLY